MEASGVLTFVFGFVIGGGVTHFVQWYYVRKIDALVKGGLRAWDQYDATADHASPTGRIVTEEGS